MNKISYIKDSDGNEKWYDENGNLVHYKDSIGYEVWKEYDKNGHLIHYKDSYGNDAWYKYDENGTIIMKTESLI